MLEVVPSLNTANVYFLFNGINERIINTDDEKLILNIYDFHVEERLYLQLQGFKIT